MTAAFDLTVHERGDGVDPAIEQRLWQQLSNDPAFWELVESKRLRVRVLAKGRVQVTGTSYVGRARIGDVSIAIDPKIEGALGSLLRFASGDAFRMHHMPSPAAEMGVLGPLLVSQYTDAVRRYVTEGRQRRYAQRPEVSSLAGGRLNMIKSVLLRARGFRHLVAFDRNTLRYNTALNRVILAALREVERLARSIQVEPASLASSRVLSALFSDAGDAEVYLASRKRFAVLAESLRNSVARQHRDVLALASLILAHQSFDAHSMSDVQTPRAWFVSLETLFESALRRILSEHAPIGVDVARGVDSERSTRLIFSNVSDRYGARPDIALRHNGHVTVVGDIKYKTWTGEPGEHDLYQLLVHAATFRTKSCFLVYPHDSFEAQDLGISSTGCRTWIFALDLNALDRHVDLLYSQIGQLVYST